MTANGDIGAMGRAATRGVVAAMAMTGLRSVTTRLGLLERTPPDAVMSEAAGLIDTVRRNRAVATELAHWTYGGLAGAAFGALPPSIRSRIWSGPAYGLAIWLVFEAAVAPFLRMQHAEQRRIVSRMAVAADHLLYGAVVGASRWPRTAR